MRNILFKIIFILKYGLSRCNDSYSTTVSSTFPGGNRDRNCSGIDLEVEPSGKILCNNIKQWNGKDFNKCIRVSGEDLNIDHCRMSITA